MAMMDIEIGLSSEDVAVRDMARKFAEEVLRPVGQELDRMPDPADVIAPESPVWQVFEKYHQLGISGLAADEEIVLNGQMRLRDGSRVLISSAGESTHTRG